MMSQMERRAKRNADRAAKMDNYTLASEVRRHAAVAARHLSYAEVAEADGEQFKADQWRFASENHEDFFLAEVDEARKRVAAGDADFVRWMNFYKAMPLIETPAPAPDPA